MAVQGELRLSTGRGGARAGAGRKKTGRCSDSPHRARPVHAKRHPVHVVLRAGKDVPRLRKRYLYTAIHAALRAAGAKAAFRVVHISVQGNHLHFLVEADDRDALSRGMQGLAISLARRINRRCRRRGKVFSLRFHATPITSPQQTRNALSYVLNNWRRHGEAERHPLARSTAIDPYSSGHAFTDWHEGAVVAIVDYTPLPVARPRTWLLREGWRRARRAISCWETPART